MLSYATPPRLIAAFSAGAAVLLVVAVDLDWPGRILAFAGALLLASEALHDAVVRPTIRADESGITVRTMRGRLHYPWPAVDDVRAHEARRLFVLQSLEIDTGDELVAVPGLRLGADPAAIAGQLQALRASTDGSVL